MTGWALFGVFAAVAGIGCFTAYWAGVGHAERRAAWRQDKLERQVNRLRVQLLDLSIQRQVEAANAVSPACLSAAEIDAWHTLICELGDEAA